MAVHLVPEYLVGLVGLAVGAGAGYVIAAKARGGGSWETTVLALVLGAGTAHLFLIPFVELMRQALFGLYFVSMAGVFVLGLAGIGIWRAGAILFPAGSIAGYFYFGLGAHQVDYAGLAIKVVELAIVVTVLALLVRRRPAVEDSKSTAQTPAS